MIFVSQYPVRPAVYPYFDREGGAFVVVRIGGDACVSRGDDN